VRHLPLSLSCTLPQGANLSRPHQRLGAAHSAVQAPRYILEGLQALQSYEVRVSYAGSVRCSPVPTKHLVSARQAALLPTHGPVQVPADLSLRLQYTTSEAARLRARSRRSVIRAPLGLVLPGGPASTQLGLKLLLKAVAATSGACLTLSGWRSAPLALSRCGRRSLRRAAA